MKTHISKSSMGKPFLIFWAVICIVAFMWIPGRVTYVQWSNLADWPLLAGKIQRLNLLQDILSFLLAFTGVTIFSLACLSLGSFVLHRTRIDRAFESKTELSGLTLAATGFLIGHGIFSVVFLTLGILYRLTPFLVILVLVVSFLVGIKTTQTSLLEAQKSLKSWYL